MNLVQKGAGTRENVSDRLCVEQTDLDANCVPGGWSLGPLAPRPCVAMPGAVGPGTRGWSPGLLLIGCEEPAGAQGACVFFPKKAGLLISFLAIAME